VKAVVDSSVLISAFLTRAGAAGALLAAGLKGHFEICVSTDILAETARRLYGSRKLRDRYGYADVEVTRYIERLNVAVHVLTDFPEITPVCCDPNDDHVLAAALAAPAAWLITGDRDLLDLGSYQGVRILSIRQALDELKHP
jgi:putative PIN family toxin of toxin-antitoxin system